MITVGGAISGYWATGSTRPAISPASVMMIEMTPAKIGRLMKNSENDMAATGQLAVLAGAFAAAAGGASATAMPGWIFSRLSMMTWSPVLSPDTIDQSAPIQSPVFTGLDWALPSASTTKT